MTYTAKLILCGRAILTATGPTRQAAIDALGYCGEPGYRVVAEREGGWV